MVRDPWDGRPTGPERERDRARRQDRARTHTLIVLLLGVGALTALLALPLLSTPGVCARASCPMADVYVLLAGIPVVCLAGAALAGSRLGRGLPAASVAGISLAIAVLALGRLLLTVG